MSPRPAKAVRGRVGDDPAAALRALLIDTVEKLLAERQVSSITTRDIARAAGVSDGVLYNYFKGKQELIVTALVRRYASVVTDFEADLPLPGSGTVEANLIAYTRAAFDVVEQTLPVAAGLMSEPDLLHAFIDEIHTQPFGPQRMQAPVLDYLKAEQRLGRLGEFDAEAAAHLMIGQAITLGFTHLLGGVALDDVVERVPTVVRTLLRGLLPRDQASSGRVSDHPGTAGLTSFSTSDPRRARLSR